MGLLGLVAGQDTEPVGDEPGRWRIRRGTAKHRVLSVFDPESRHAHKTAHSCRDGCKAHIATAPHTGVITAANLTPGDTGDADGAMGLLASARAQARTTEFAHDYSQHRPLAERSIAWLVRRVRRRPCIGDARKVLAVILA